MASFSLLLLFGFADLFRGFINSYEYLILAAFYLALQRSYEGLVEETS